MNLIELVERVKVLAVETGGSPNSAAPDNPLLDAEILIEILLPRIFKKCAESALKHPERVGALRKNHTVVFASGQATLPVGVSEDFGAAITLFDTAGTPEAADFNQSVSRERYYFDFRRSGDFALFPLFCTENGKIYLKRTGEAYDTAALTLTLSAVTTPQMPATESTQIDCPADLLEEIILETAAVVRGEKPLALYGLEVANLTAKPKRA